MAKRRRARRPPASVPACSPPLPVTVPPSDAGPAKLPNKVIFSIVYIVGFFLVLKAGLLAGLGLFSIPGMLVFGTLVYSAWTILWFICMRWPLLGIFIIGTLWSFFGGRRRRW